MLGRRKWGRGTAGRNPDERDGGTEARAVFSMVHSVTILDISHIIELSPCVELAGKHCLQKSAINYFIDNWSLLSETLCHWGSSFSPCFCIWVLGGNFLPSSLCFMSCFFYFFFNCAKCVANYALSKKQSRPLHISQSSYIRIHDLV